MLQAWTKLANLFKADDRQFQARMADARKRAPTPVFWLFGRTQSGKTSIVKHMTGATDAEIGSGFRPCTRFSREYPFPNAEAPLLDFLDTRGLDEPGYDPEEDLNQFNNRAHVIVVTVKVTDHAQENVERHLKTIRAAKPGRPVILALTCLHEAYPQRQHPQPYPFKETLYPDGLPQDLLRSIAAQHERFKPLVDDIIPIDLTRPEEGFDDPNYGGQELHQSILKHLPAALRQTLLTLDESTHEFRDAALKRAMPLVLSYSTLAAGAGAIPVPFVDLLLIPGIQAKMVQALADSYGQPMTKERFWEIASSIGSGVVARQAAREAAKVIPGIGAAAGAALAWGLTYALGRAFCQYFQSIREGHVPDPAELKQLFDTELAKAGRLWK
ncbi:MAG TPA: DUF697 domain-containing protein [Gemmataceae bacterium]|jgi:uncharacterized protein (DUF697 family)|nr:DUF697 domain-containing protein [Gemmataceae bacterium]